MNHSQDDLLLDDGAPASGTDYAQVLLFGIGRFRYWILLFVMLGGLGGLAAALMQPNQFSSEVKLLVRPGIRMLRSPGSILDPNQAAAGSASVVFDEVHLLSNPELPARVVQKVGAHIVLQPYDPTSMDTEKTSRMMRWLHGLQVSWFSRSSASIADDLVLAQQAAAQTIAANLRLVTARGTDVIAIYYTAHSPEIAQTVAEAFLEVALERHGEVFASEANLKMVTKKYEQAIERADKADKAFLDHRNQCGIVDFNAQRGEMVRIIAQVRAQIERDRIQLESIKAELKLLDERLANTDSEVAVEQPMIALPQLNPEYDQVRLILRGLLDQRGSLSAEFVPDSDHYRSEYAHFTAQIEEKQARLGNMEEWLAMDAAGYGAANPVYAQTLAIRLAREQQQRGLLAGVNSRKQSLKLYETQLGDLMKCELVHDNHLDAISRAGQAVETLATVYTRENALAAIDQSASLMVIQPAILPTTKDGPERIQTLLLGLFLGLFVGLAFAALRQFATSKIRYPEEVETVLGVPVLGLIPESRSWRRLGRKIVRNLDSEQKQASPEPA